MKDIKEYEGKYAVTEDGQVWSYRSKKFLKQSNTHGYLQVTLYKDGKGKIYRVHRLVAETYIPNPDNLPQVNHKDEKRDNNRVENLEWCDAKYNNNYGKHNKTISKEVLCIELNQSFESASEAAKQLGLNRSHIASCCRGERKTHGGYSWEYASC